MKLHAAFIATYSIGNQRRKAQVKSKKGKFVGSFLKIPDILSSASFDEYFYLRKTIDKKVRNLNDYKLFILDLYIFDHLEINSKSKILWY